MASTGMNIQASCHRRCRSLYFGALYSDVRRVSVTRAQDTDKTERARVIIVRETIKVRAARKGRPRALVQSFKFNRNAANEPGDVSVPLLLRCVRRTLPTCALPSFCFILIFLNTFYLRRLRRKPELRES